MDGNDENNTSRADEQGPKRAARLTPRVEALRRSPRIRSASKRTPTTAPATKSATETTQDKETPRTMIRALTRQVNPNDTSVASTATPDVSIRSTRSTRSGKRKAGRESKPRGTLAEKDTPRTLIRHLVQNTSQFDDTTILNDTTRVTDQSASSTVLSTSNPAVLSFASATHNLSNQISPNTSTVLEDSTVLPTESQLDFIHIPKQRSRRQQPQPADARTAASTNDGDAEHADTEAGPLPPLRRPTRRTGATHLSTVLPNAVIKHLVHRTGSKLKFSQGALEEIGQRLDSYVDDISSDLQQLAEDDGRATIGVNDVEMLMLRRGSIASTHDLRALLHKHLPLEYVEQLIPAAVGDNNVHPSCKKPKLTI